MLATPWPHPFADADWLFEPKWDGYRATLSFDGTRVSLRSRRGTEITDRFPELGAPHLDAPAVLDGEIVVLEDGVPSFERLQQRSGSYSISTAALHPVSFVGFDLLFLGDRPLIREPIEQRLEALRGLGLGNPFGVVEPVVGDGLDLWEVVVATDLEGVIAKRMGSPYRPGVRSEDWRKIHNIHTARAVVGGFTRGEGGRRETFGALLVGMWEGDRLRWVGSVGTGFSDADLKVIRSVLDTQARPDSPFEPDEGLPTNATWVDPSLVAAVGYRNWTTARRLRHPRFKGFTDDPPESVTWEAEGPT